MRIGSLHPYSFRPGERAAITGVKMVRRDGETEFLPCFEVRYRDGEVDYTPIFSSPDAFRLAPSHIPTEHDDEVERLARKICESQHGAGMADVPTGLGNPPLIGDGRGVRYMVSLEVYPLWTAYVGIAEIVIREREAKT